MKDTEATGDVAPILTEAEEVTPKLPEVEAATPLAQEVEDAAPLPTGDSDEASLKAESESEATKPPKIRANKRYKIDRRGLIGLIVGAAIGLALGFFVREVWPSQWVVFLGFILAFFGTILGIGTSNDYSSPSEKGDPETDYKLGTRQFWAAFGMLGLAFASATSVPVTPEVDPLTCYIAGDQVVGTQSATLRCGVGESVTIPLGADGTSAELQEDLGNMEITKAVVNTSQDGATVIKLFTSVDDRTCTISHNMADSPERTSVACKGPSTP